MDKLNKAVAGGIQRPGSYQRELPSDLEKAPMEMVAVARKMIAQGDTSEGARLSLYNQANRMFSDAQKLIATDVSRAEAERTTGVLGTLAYLDTVGTQAQKPQIAFLRGATSVILGAHIKFRAAQTTRSCILAQEAKTHVRAAQVNLAQGTSVAPAATLQALLDLATRADSQIDLLMVSLPNCR